MFDKEKLKAQVMAGKITTPEDLQSIMREITKEIIDVFYDGELEAHLGYKKHDIKAKKKSNSRNGHSSKTVNSSFGKMELKVPRDREGTYDPVLIKKYQTDISGIESKVISMYAFGMSTRDIQAHIDEIYGHQISPETISRITDTIVDKAKEWQNRPLDQIYSIVFMDAIIVKMRVDGVAKNVAIYCILGYNLGGIKEVLGLYITENAESAKYWLTVMTDLKNRGIEDILIFSVDNLPGISEAITAVFSKSEIQKCIVHQIRNSLKYVPWKERKIIAADLKLIYSAPNEKAAIIQLENFEKKWNKKYPHISKQWRNNWTELATFFKYPAEIRKLIYTTNPTQKF